MFHDINLSTDQFRKNRSIQSYNQVYFFDYDISSLKSLGIPTNPPQKVPLTFSDRAIALDQELDLYNTHFTCELNKIVAFNKSFNINDIINEFNQTENIIIKKYKDVIYKDKEKLERIINYIYKEDLPRLKKIIENLKDFNETYSRYKVFQSNLIDYLDKVEYNQKNKFDTIYTIIKHELDLLENPRKKILTEDAFIKIRDKLIREINNIHIDVIPFKKNKYW